MNTLAVQNNNVSVEQVEGMLTDHYSRCGFPKIIYLMSEPGGTILSDARTQGGSWETTELGCILKEDHLDM